MSLDGVSFVLGLHVSLQSFDIFGGLAPLILSWIRAVGIVQANFRNIGVRKKVSKLPPLINADTITKPVETHFEKTSCTRATFFLLKFSLSTSPRNRGL